MSEKNYKYDAFISYRHTEPDKFVAENLHKMMEAFKPPKSILAKSNRKKIERVFRDRDELPLASNLEDPIVDALANSEYLIVICSPRLPQSIWCKKEIQTFIEMHGRRNILAVLVEGEPEDSFPEELLYENIETTDSEGNIHIEKKPVEPLAADCRGKNNAEIKKAMKSEILRLLAPMFNVGYDDLKQRHKEQRIKKIAALSAIIAVLAIGFGIYSTLTALKIKSQANQLAQNQAVYLAEKAQVYHTSDDRKRAIETAMTALTEYNGVQMPETAEAMRTLAEVLRVYDGGYYINPSDYVQTDFIIDKIKVSPNKEKLITIEKSGTVTMWSTENYEKLFVVADGNSLSAIEFLNDDIFFYTDYSDGIVFANTSDGLPASGYWSKKDLGLTLGARVSSDQQIIGIRKMNNVEFYQAKDGKLIYTATPENGDFVDLYINGTTAYIMGMTSDFSKLATTLTAIDLKTGTTIFSAEYPQGVAITMNYASNGANEYLLLSGSFTKILVNASTGEYITHQVIEDNIALVQTTDQGAFMLYAQNGFVYLYNPDKQNDLNGLKYINCNNIKQFEYAGTKLVGVHKNDDRLVFYTYFKNIDSEVYEGEGKEIEDSTLKDEQAKEWARSNGVEHANAISSCVEIPEAGFFVSNFSDGSIRVFSSSDGSLINTSRENALGNAKYYGKLGDYYIVSFSVEEEGPVGFAFNKNGQICTTIPSFAGITADGSKVIVYGRDDNRTPANIALPIYDKEKLIEKAKKVLEK